MTHSAPPSFSLSDLLGDAATAGTIVDIGALEYMGGGPPYAPLLGRPGWRGIGFDPLSDAPPESGPAGPEGAMLRCLPHAVGDGGEATFHVCNYPMTSSLLKPNAAFLRRFDDLPEYCEVVDTRPVRTTRLDDIPEVEGADYVKIDVQGATGQVLEGGGARIGEALAVHSEVDFGPLYEGAESFGSIYDRMIALGFELHHFPVLVPRGLAADPPAAPPIETPRPRDLWGDALFVPRLDRIEALTPDRQRRLAVIAHDCYDARDLAHHCLALADAAEGTSFAQAYRDGIARPADAAAPAAGPAPAAASPGPVAVADPRALLEGPEAYGMISYAQNGEDVMLQRLFREEPRGWYVDVGAFDPTLHSVTRHFHERGWRGVNLEPIASRHARFERDRPEDVNLNAAIGDVPGRLTFHECLEEPALSTLGDEDAEAMREKGWTFDTYEVDVLTLDDVFERHCPGTVDFLKIDIEGGEEMAVRSFDFARFRPRAVVVEATLPATNPDGMENIERIGTWHAWEGVLLEAGYALAHFDGLNRFYLREEDAHLAERLRLPPNVHDIATPYRHLEERQRLRDSEAERAASEAAHRALEEERAASIDERDRAIDERDHAIDALRDRNARLESKRLRNRLRRVSKRLKRYREGLLTGAMPPRPLRPRPRITVVTPVFDAAGTLRETIESVLAQEGAEFEYIVVDGGSTDGSAEIAREYEDRLAHLIVEPDEGMYDAVAKGFERATGDVLCYLNADDLFERGALERVADAFQRTKRQVVYFEDSITVDGWRFPNAPQRPVDRVTIHRGHILFQDGVFFTRRAYERVGGLDRHMRLAGDWALWSKLSRRYGFERLRGHVSSFRMRPGQLSSDMEAYNAEMEAERQRLKGSRRGYRLAKPVHWVNRLRAGAERVASRWGRRRRLYFPFDHQLPPPEGVAPGIHPGAPADPLDGSPPTELLFSSRDTRFTNDRINYLYYHADTDLVSVYPPLDRETLKGLYATHYNDPAPQIRHPEPGRGTPYVRFRPRNAVLRRLVKLRLPRKLLRRMRKWGVLKWDDQTLEELRAAVSGLLPKGVAEPRVLDVGCFNGILLDRIARETNWRTFGAEPNEAAAEEARGRGHRVWTCEVEDILETVPAGERFDVIFMGQVIEHINDPLQAVMHLSALLAPGGLLVMSTPNLDSVQIEAYGPTWSHWHPPYHRHVFSPRSMARLGAQAGLRQVRCRTYSHPYWTWLSHTLRGLGLGGSVPHGLAVPEEDKRVVESISVAMSLFYNWRGKGDYMHAVFRKDFR